MDWPGAFALTCVVELPLVAAVAPPGRRRGAAVDSLGANLLTHPLVWLLNRRAALPWTVLELGAFAVEAAVYRGVTRLCWGRAVLASGLANAVTAALSFVV